MPLAEAVPTFHQAQADYGRSGQLQDRGALLSGGDTKHWTAVAIAFAQEGANIAIV